MIACVQKIHTFTNTGTEHQMSNVGVVKYGPDVRLYVESQKSTGHALTLDSGLKDTKKYTNNVSQNGLRRWIFGNRVQCDERSVDNVLCFTSNRFNWKELNITSDFAKVGQAGKFRMQYATD